MQLRYKRRRKLRKTLLASTCVLLGVTPKAMAAKGDWAIDSSALFYSETGGIQVLEPAVQAKQDLGNGSFLTWNMVGDVLTGATPTGGMPSSQVQTVSGPSGKKQTTIAPGNTPKNDYFHDLRAAVSATWSQPLGDVWQLDLGGSVSLEDDFRSLGVNTLLVRNFNENNTTLATGVSYEYDNVAPKGGIPDPLHIVPAGSTLPIAHSRTKSLKDALIGVTQVINQDWLAQLNFSFGDSRGYLTNPYKQVSVIASQTLPQTPQGDPLYQIYENRPPTREQRALYLRNKVYLGGNVLDVTYRYGWDTWNIHSNTLDVRYRWALGDHYYLQPEVRYYHQGAAYFYQRGLLNSEALPAYVSADYRLASFTGRTVGIEFGTRVGAGHWLPPGRLIFRIAHYSQGGGTQTNVDIGTQRQFDLFPGLSANIVQADYSFKF